MFNSLKRSAKTQVADVALPDTIKSLHRQVGTDSKEIAAWLGELAQKEVEANDTATSLFRTQAIQEMDAATTLRDNPEQSANFRVLLTAKVPSVLIELAYVSNQQDAKLLKSDEWRHKVSDSIATAVENYFANQRERLPMSAAATQ
jgi:N-acetylmuramoyl-L-alanine amidase